MSDEQEPTPANWPRVPQGRQDVTVLSTEAALAEMHRTASVPLDDEFVSSMTTLLEDGLVVGGLDGDGGLHWRVTPAGVAARDALASAAEPATWEKP